MGSPHPLQVNGIGGGDPLTSKVAIISPSTRPGIDVEYLFAQVGVTQAVVDTNPNCGNMLSAVGPFAIEAGLVQPGDAETTVRIFNRNTGKSIHAVVQTPGGAVTYDGSAEIDGVAGSAAPIKLTFLDATGSKTSGLFPTGERCETIDGIEVSLVDYAMPMMLVRAADVGLAGNETPDDLDARRATCSAGSRSCAARPGAAWALATCPTPSCQDRHPVEPRRADGTITSRYLVPHRTHKAHAVTGALCVAVAAERREPSPSISPPLAMVRAPSSSSIRAARSASTSRPRRTAPCAAPASSAPPAASSRGNVILSARRRRPPTPSDFQQNKHPWEDTTC